MELKDYLIALFFVVAFATVIFAFIARTYSPLGFDVDMESDPSLSFLVNLSKTSSQYQSDTNDYIDGSWQRTIGENNTDIPPDSVSDYDLIRNSWASLPSLKGTITIFKEMTKSMVQNLQIDPVIYWFVTISIITIIALIVIGAVLNKVL